MTIILLNGDKYIQVKSIRFENGRCFWAIRRDIKVSVYITEIDRIVED